MSAVGGSSFHHHGDVKSSITNYKDNAVDLAGVISRPDATKECRGSILLIHGLNSSKGTWKGVLDCLKENYIIAALDLRGHGESPRGNDNYSLPQLSADIDKFVTHHGLNHLCVVGHSLGGEVAAFYAQEHPEAVKAVIIEDIDFAPRTSKKVSIEHLEKFQQNHPDLASVEKTLIEYGYAWGIKSDSPSVDGCMYDGVINAWIADGRINHLEDSTYQIGLNPLVSHCIREAVVVSDTPLEAFKKLTTPLLLLRAEKYPETSDANVAKIVEIQPAMQVAFLKGSDHSIHKSAFPLFLDYLQKFINDLKR